MTSEAEDTMRITDAELQDINKTLISVLLESSQQFLTEEILEDEGFRYIRDNIILDISFRNAKLGGKNKRYCYLIFMGPYLQDINRTDMTEGSDYIRFMSACSSLYAGVMQAYSHIRKSDP
jgi:hypothetical protein